MSISELKVIPVFYDGENYITRAKDSEGYFEDVDIRPSIKGHPWPHRFTIKTVNGDYIAYNRETDYSEILKTVGFINECWHKYWLELHPRFYSQLGLENTREYADYNPGNGSDFGRLMVEMPQKTNDFETIFTENFEEVSQTALQYLSGEQMTTVNYDVEFIVKRAYQYYDTDYKLERISDDGMLQTYNAAFYSPTGKLLYNHDVINNSSLGTHPESNDFKNTKDNYYFANGTKLPKGVVVINLAPDWLR
ncbi:MAG: hypothetical protein K2H50_07765 [Paramuribaculum sp.]|nr:hypothetical protein [Paramuribaculum sp.]